MKKRLIILGIICFIIAGIASIGIAQDAFEPNEQLVLTPHIGTIRIEIIRTVNPSELPEGQTQAIKYVLIVDDQFHNSMDVRDGNLIPILTTAQKNQLIAFMDMLWQKAEDEILP